MSEQATVGFRPGAGTAIVTEHAVALIAASSTSPVCTGLADVLVRGGGLDQMMSVVAAIGTSILPGFAVVVRTPVGIQFVHRGEVVVDVEHDGAQKRFSSPRVTTWREEEVADARTVVLGIGPVLDEETHWVTTGLVPATQLRWAVGRAAEGAQPTEPRQAFASGRSDVSGQALDARQGVDAQSEGDVSVEPSPFPAPMGVGSSVPDPTVEAINVTNVTLFGEADDIDLHNLLIETVHHTIEDAAVRASATTPETDSAPPATDVSATIAFDPAEFPAPEPPTGPTTMIAGVPTPPDEDVGAIATGDSDEHDGYTVARRRRHTPPADSDPPTNPAQALVQAVVCSTGHYNSTQAHRCRVCDVAIVDFTTWSIPRPPLGVLRFSSGLEVEVNGPIVIGRSPRVDRLIDGEPAQVVAVDDDELSRVHLVIHVTDWYVQVADQSSMNGSVVVRPGKPPQVLRPMEKVQIVPGTDIDLGGTVHCRFDAA